MSFRTLPLLAAAASVACLLLFSPSPSSAFAPTQTRAASVAVQSPPAVRLALFGRGKSSAPPSSSAEADEAVSTFARKFASRRKNKPIDESVLRTSFSELSSLFGDDDALKIVRAVPEVLEFRSSYFADIVSIFEDKFGKDGTRGLILRNPGLLGIKPDGWGEEGYGGAATAGPETIAISYVVAATRPLGNFGLVGLLALILTPGIDAVTGLGIRDAFLSALGVK